jgi:hypothetical protein
VVLQRGVTVFINLLISSCLWRALPVNRLHKTHLDAPRENKIIHCKMQSPIPVSARSEAWVYSPSLAGIAGSNTAGGWMFVSCECRMLSGVGLCVGLITRPEDPTECDVSECNHAISLSCTSCYFFIFFYRSSWQTAGSVSKANRLHGLDGWRIGVWFQTREEIFLLPTASRLTLAYLTFRGPCIVIYSCNKTNEMH